MPLRPTLPLAATAATSGSPQQSVEADPDESVESKKIVTEGSVAAEIETGSPAQSVDADEDEEVAMDDAGEGTIADELPTNSPQVTN